MLLKKTKEKKIAQIGNFELKETTYTKSGGDGVEVKYMPPIVITFKDEETKKRNRKK